MKYILSSKDETQFNNEQCYKLFVKSQYKREKI